MGGRLGGAVLGIALLSGCTTATEVRVHNASAVEIDRLTIAGVDYGELRAGTMSDYRGLRMTLRYATLELEVAGRHLTGQTLNFGSRRFTYEITAIDVERGQLAIDVVPD